jgi:hypothetical protein
VYEFAGYTSKEKQWKVLSLELYSLRGESLLTTRHPKYHEIASFI